MSNVTKKQKGFTLIELLIVISIIAILATMGIGSFTNTNAIIQFDSFTNKVASIFREAHSLSLNGEAIADYTDYDEDKYFYPESGACGTPVTTKTNCPSPNSTQTDCFCDVDEKILAAGYGLSFDGQSIKFFTDLHNQSEGSFSEAGGYSTTKDEFNTAKSLDLAGVEFKNYAFMINSNTNKGAIIYTTPYGDAIFNGVTDKDLLIWLYDKNTGCVVNGARQGKVIAVNKVAGVPEIMQASDLTIAQQGEFNIICSK